MCLFNVVVSHMMSPIACRHAGRGRDVAPRRIINTQPPACAAETQPTTKAHRVIIENANNTHPVAALCAAGRYETPSAFVSDLR